MDNQTVLIGIGILILLIVIVFAIVMISIVSIQKPIQKIEPEQKSIQKEPIFDRLLQAIEKTNYRERNFHPNNYQILLNYKSFLELERYLRSQIFYYPVSPQILMGIEVRRVEKLEQDFLIFKKEE